MKTNEAEKMDLRSLDIAAEKRSELKHALGEAFPEVFAEGLIDFEQLKLFVKLPAWFKIDTPIGSYNPDWAFVTHHHEKVYFVRETKSTLDSEERRTKENQKIACGRKHFDSIGVDYDVVTSLSEVAIR